MQRTISRKTAVASCLAFIVSLGIAGCGTGTGDASGEGDASEIVAEASKNVEQAFANNGAEFKLDPVANPRALDGKTVMYLSAGLTSPAGSAAVRSLKAVQESIPFELVTFDGQFTTSRYQEGMRQAIAQKVDVLIVYGVDCAGNEAALKEVHTAGIKIVGVQSVDCNEADPNAKPLFDAQSLYPLGEGKTGTIGQTWAALGATQADYLISELNGDVRVIQFDVPDFAVTASLGKGFRARMKQCSTCKILETVQVGVADMGAGLQPKAEQVLLKHPDANAVELNYDDLVTLGLSAAIKSSGRQQDLLTIAGTGTEATMDMIRKDDGLLSAGWVEEYDWDHWAAIDTTLRLLSGEKAAVSGVPIILYDKDHNMPESGGFVPETDYQATFKSAWGVK